jgi:hypothetical protein
VLSDLILKVVKKERISHFVSGYRKFEFANIVYDEKFFGSERILGYGFII